MVLRRLLSRKARAKTRRGEPAARRSPDPAGAAQNPHAYDIADFGRLPVGIFDDRDGLPQNSVQALAVDRKGYFWIGTEDGAAYYNGRTWTAVDMPNHARSNYIRKIASGSDGSLWFGTYGGG